MTDMSGEELLEQAAQEMCDGYLKNPLELSIKIIEYLHDESIERVGDRSTVMQTDAAELLRDASMLLAARPAAPEGGLLDKHVRLNGYDTNEPTLRELVQLYYFRHFSAEIATRFANEYIAALTAQSGEAEHTIMPRGGMNPDWHAESIKLYRANKKMRAALQEQHDWHLRQGDKDFGDGIVIDMAGEYGESAMYERTVAALDAVLPAGIAGYEQKIQNRLEMARTAETTVRLLPGDPLSEGAWRPTHRHIKTGGLYRVVLEGVMEADMTNVVIYENELGAAWVRPKQEFYDGRFETLPPPPADQQGG